MCSGSRRKDSWIDSNIRCCPSFQVSLFVSQKSTLQHFSFLPFLAFPSSSFLSFLFSRFFSSFSPSLPSLALSIPSLLDFLLDNQEHSSPSRRKSITLFLLTSSLFNFLPFFPMVFFLKSSLPEIELDCTLLIFPSLPFFSCIRASFLSFLKTSTISSTILSVLFLSFSLSLSFAKESCLFLLPSVKWSLHSIESLAWIIFNKCKHVHIHTFFRGIMELLELMKLDMTNFTIEQLRPHLQQQSVEYERTKFKEFLETQSSKFAPRSFALAINS